MTAIITHYAYARGGAVAVGFHIRRVSKKGDEAHQFGARIMLAPEEASEMAEAIRDEFGKFRRESPSGAVEIWREPCEPSEIIWTFGGDEIRFPIDPRDGWSWDYAEDIGKASEEAAQ